MQAGAVRSAKAMVAFIPTSATGLVPLSRRGVKTVCMQPQRVAVHLTAALSLITKAGPCSKLAEVKRRQATEEHDVNYSHSSGVEKYPCEFWPALLLFCMMLCFEVKKKNCIVTRGMLAFFTPGGARLLPLHSLCPQTFVTSDLNYASSFSVCLFLFFFSLSVNLPNLWIFYIHNIL